jgi:23S rRNA U2552 (ribose-2'-O)-methylase RlmE/FtsJ
MKIRLNGTKIKAACIDDNYDFTPEFEEGDSQEIVAIDQLPSDDLEKLEYIDGEVRLKSSAALDLLEENRKLKADFVKSDDEFIRVIEDILDALEVKGVLALEDLPQAAQDKINYRKNLRS